MVNFFSEEHRKRENKSGVRCPFFMTITQATLGKATSSRPPSKRISSKPQPRANSRAKDAPIIVSDTDDEIAISPSEPEPEPSRSKSTKLAKSVGSRASSVSVKKLARTTSVEKKAPGSRATTASEVDDTEGGSGSDIGKRATAKKKGKTKEQIEVIREEEEDEEPEEEVVEKPKRKRGRPPKASTKPSVAADDTEVDPAPSKPVHSRTRSRTFVESESDTQLPTSTRPTRAVRQSSVTKTLQRQPSFREEKKTADAEMTNGKRTKMKGSKVSEDELPMPKAKVAKSIKNGRNGIAPSQSQDDDIISGSEDQGRSSGSVHELREAHLPSRTSVSTSKTRPTTNHVQRSKGKHRETSSISDDAGYATAEPHMDVDVDVESRSSRAHDLPNPLDPKSIRKINGKTRVSSTSKQRVEMRVSEDELEPDADVEMFSAHDRSPPPNPRLSSIAESPDKEARVERGSISRNRIKSLQLGDTQEEVLDEKIQPKLSEPLSIKRSVASTGKKKQLQVEVIVPSSEPDSQDEDVRMTDARQGTVPNGDIDEPNSAVDTVEEEPEPPTTPSTRSNHDDSQDGPSVSDTLFTPFLSLLPMSKLTSLTEEERAMTVEQWIGREIERQHQQFKEDAERKIEEFREQAAESRRKIEAL